MKTKKKKMTAKQIDKRINAIYNASCSGIQIPIMNVWNVFQVANEALVANPDLDDAGLQAVIRAYVETIRVN